MAVERPARLPELWARWAGWARGVVCTAGVALSWASSAQAQAPTQPQPQPPAPLLAACAVCHGAGGNAQINQFPSLAGQPRLFIENQLVLIREGLRDVPTMKDTMAGMSDDTIIGLARHFSALALQPRPGPTDAARTELGARIAKGMLCGTCHLPSYLGQQQVPRLAGQNEVYLLQAMKDFRDKPGPGRDTLMSEALRGLKDDELGHLAHYLARFGVTR